jgi:site-specific recombinase XerD
MNPKQLAHKQRELTKLAEKIRAQGKSLETERSYCRAVGKFIDYLCSRSWAADATAEDKVEHFLTAEARRDVSASTQNGSFHAICYYYHDVRKTPLQDVDALRAKRGEQVRQAPGREDTRKVLMAVADSGAYPCRLICHLLYGCGLRLGETLSIRLKDLDLEAGRLTIIGGKGKKDRFITLPPSLLVRIANQVKVAEAIQKRAAIEGVPVKLPNLYAKKNPQSAFQRRWFWLFPQNQPCIDPRSKARVWWHCLPSTVQTAMRTANRRAKTEGITPHHLRHAWATHAADDGAHLRDLQVVLGHKDIQTTARYVRPNPERVPSPIEKMDFAA